MKKGVICLVIMFNSKVIIIKASKMAVFVFSDDGIKKQSQFGQLHMKDSTEFIQKLYSLWLLLSQQKILKPSFFKDRHLAKYH